MSTFEKPERGFLALPIEKQKESLEKLIEEFDRFGLGYQANILYKAINE